jgi:hypothetical protein
VVLNDDQLQAVGQGRLREWNIKSLCRRESGGEAGQNGEQQADQDVFHMPHMVNRDLGVLPLQFMLQTQRARHLSSSRA